MYDKMINAQPSEESKFWAGVVKLVYYVMVVSACTKYLFF